MLKGINIYFCSGILNINLTQYVVFKKEHFFVVCPDQRGSIAKELAPIGIYLFYVPPCSVYILVYMQPTLSWSFSSVKPN